MSQDRSLERPKRNIKKPDRFLTTSSSDDGPRRIPPQKKSSVVSATALSHMVNEDIDDIRRTLEEDKDETSLFNIDTHTPTQSYTNIKIHTNHPSLLHYAPRTQTHISNIPNLQTYINTQPTPTPAPFTQQPTQAQNLSFSAEGGRVFYTNSTLSQLQVPGALILQEDQGYQRGLYVGQGDAPFRPRDMQYENTDQRRMEEYLHRVRAAVIPNGGTLS
ncbi:uncharacterized protein LOC116850183 isoform X1 [Odontomachus brunneus]|uniref:uncharacterized protein LOC116850183 isoform X1 n=1 Tax=Odontomachus brunneus TaxID=486640 RepID=UPI0013F27E72|nr:uncharacterized protein LOC116850183 isoform X1 [Odontomachus brunneus]